MSNNTLVFICLDLYTSIIPANRFHPTFKSHVFQILTFFYPKCVEPHLLWTFWGGATFRNPQIFRPLWDPLAMPWWHLHSMKSCYSHFVVLGTFLWQMDGLMSNINIFNDSKAITKQYNFIQNSMKPTHHKKIPHKTKHELTVDNFHHIWFLYFFQHYSKFCWQFFLYWYLDIIYINTLIFYFSSTMSMS